jgi:hypothetical protein
MLLIAGTVPVKDLPLTTGQVSRDGEHLMVNSRHIPCTQGTGTMIDSALATTKYLGVETPYALVVGDDGRGEGSNAMYRYLIENTPELPLDVLALHYCLPNMGLTRRLCSALKNCVRRPRLVADAASMYAAKAAGLAPEFDIFTPDATEMAFLADPNATHPAYISRHLFDTDATRIPQLVADAYRQNSAAEVMLVKGAIDYVTKKGEIITRIDKPDVPALEAIGGTGDTITGLVSAFLYAGLEPHEAAIIAARANRVAGQYAGVTPATRVRQIISHFPEVFREHLCQWSGVCYGKGENKDG